jgi:hypothetical protein
MASSIGGPLFLLRWKGAICPCLEKQQDTGARLALDLLSGLPVKWYRTGRDAKSLGGLMSGWFNNSSSKDDKDAVDAILEWIDTEKGPELQIKPQQQQQSEGEIQSLQKQSVGYIKTVHLKQLDKVIIQEETYIVLQSEKKDGKYQDLATLQVVTGNDARQMKEAFTQLLEWDGRRLADIPEEDRETEEDTLKQKAQKAAHFAKREIELGTQRREREKRKAEYVKGSGGLKYTALAMANRTDG